MELHQRLGLVSLQLDTLSAHSHSEHIRGDLIPRPHRNFFNSTVTQNNLGGLGPDTGAEELRFSSVWNENGKASMDLVVTYKGGRNYTMNKGPAPGSRGYVSKGCDSTITAYDDARYCGGRNGLWSDSIPGFFGQINIASGYAGYFDFALVHTGTNTPFEMKADEKVLFSFYDLDDNRSDRRPQFEMRREFIEFVTPPASHSLTINTTVVVNTTAGGNLYAESGRYGTGDDNPVSPLDMTPLAQSSRISVVYKGISTWTVKFGTTGYVPGDAGGRNMLFAGRSKGDCACVGVSNWDIHNNLASNNLGGLGPTFSDPAELRYSKVFQTGSGTPGAPPVDIDLVIRNTTKYEVANTAYNGMWPTTSDHTQMGQFNVKCGTETTFDFIFVESGTDTPFGLSNILFSVYDLDALDRFKNAEYVTFPTPVTNYALTTPTQIAKSGENDGSLKFSSTQHGIVADNPTNPKDLTGLQMARSVTIWQSGGSKISATMGHYIDEADFIATGSSWPNGRIGGRNFLFAGPGVYCPATTSVPTPAPEPMITITTQVATFSFSVSAYTGTMKSAVESGYAQALGIWNSNTNALVDGCTISSTAASARRSAAVTFVSHSPETVAPSTVTQAALASAVNASATAAGIAPPTVSNLQSATVTTTSGTALASDDSSSSLVVIIVAVVAAVVVTAAVLIMCFIFNGDKAAVDVEMKPGVGGPPSMGQDTSAVVGYN